MKNTLRGAPVLGGVVKHPLVAPVTAHDVRDKFIAFAGQRKRTGKAVTIENECLRGQAGGFTGGIQILVQEALDAPIGWTLVICQKACGLPIVGEHRLGEVAKAVVIGLRFRRWASDRSQFEIDVCPQPRADHIRLRS